MNFEFLNVLNVGKRFDDGYREAVSVIILPRQLGCIDDV